MSYGFAATPLHRMNSNRPRYEKVLERDRGEVIHVEMRIKYKYIKIIYSDGS